MTLLLLLLLLGCPYYPEAPLSVSAVDPGPDGDGTLDCDQAVQAIDTVIRGQGWTLVDDDRPVWTPDVEHLGNARVYTGGGVEVMVVATTDLWLETQWGEGTPVSCPMADYGGTCDEAWCDDVVADPCAHLLQAPCDVAWDSDFYRNPTLVFLSSLE